MINTSERAYFIAVCYLHALTLTDCRDLTAPDVKKVPNAEMINHQLSASGAMKKMQTFHQPQG